MSKNTKETTKTEKSGQKPVRKNFFEMLQEQGSKADNVRTYLVSDIDGIQLIGDGFDSSTVEQKRSNINIIYKLRNAFRTIKASDDKDVLTTIVSSNVTKELIEETEKIDGIFSSIGLRNKRLLSSGNFEDMKQSIDAGIDVTNNVQQAIAALKNAVEKALDAGFGNKRDVETYAKNKRRKQILDELSSGKTISEIKTSISASDNEILNIFNPNKGVYIEAHKAKVEKAFMDKVSMKEIAELIEIETKKANFDAIYRSVKEWSESDAKLKKALSVFDEEREKAKAEAAKVAEEKAKAKEIAKKEAIEKAKAKKEADSKAKVETAKVAEDKKVVATKKPQTTKAVAEDKTTKTVAEKKE